MTGKKEDLPCVDYNETNDMLYWVFFTIYGATSTQLMRKLMVVMKGIGNGY